VEREWRSRKESALKGQMPIKHCWVSSPAELAPKPWYSTLCHGASPGPSIRNINTSDGLFQLLPPVFVISDSAPLL
jgi:hypothetical protein